MNSERAIEIINGHIKDSNIAYGTLTAQALRVAIIALKQPEQEWIPCSKQLPEDFVDVLVWFEYFRYGNYNCLYQTYGLGTYNSNYDTWMINNETGWRKLRVIAWMPLPEPYREEKRIDE